MYRQISPEASFVVSVVGSIAISILLILNLYLYSKECATTSTGKSQSPVDADAQNTTRSWVEVLVMHNWERYLADTPTGRQRISECMAYHPQKSTNTSMLSTHTRMVSDCINRGFISM